MRVDVGESYKARIRMQLPLLLEEPLNPETGSCSCHQGRAEDGAAST